jgi:hypothetical protein
LCRKQQKRMKVWIWASFALVFLTLNNCKKDEKNLNLHAKNANDSIPRYDSLNWSKAFKF